jgi:hypothetical protein
MVNFVTDKRFLVGLGVGAFVVPYLLKQLSMRRAKPVAV